MNNTTFTFKYLDIPKYEAVENELNAFYAMVKDKQVYRTKNKDNASIMKLNIDDQGVQGVGVLTKYTFVHLDPEITMQNLPTLATYFKQVGLSELSRIAIIVTHPNQTQDIHIDQGEETLGINFPLAGTSATYTRIFKNKGKVEYAISHDETSSGVKEQRRYLKYIDDSPEEIARYELNQPVMLNVKMPHSVVNLSGDERVGISFRFKEDPWSLSV